MFKKFVLALALTIPVLGHAEYFELPTDWNSTSFNLITNHTSAGGSFADEWNFNITDPNSFVVSGGFFTDGFFVEGIENFSGYLIGDDLARLDFKVDNANFSSPYLSLSQLLQTTPLVAGNYSIVFEGISTGTTGGYYGANPVTAVPEPESIWLMGTGLGLVSLMKRKKYTQ
jgi:hypothetical protein